MRDDTDRDGIEREEHQNEIFFKKETLQASHKLGPIHDYIASTCVSSVAVSFPSNSHDGSPPNMLEATQHYPQNRTRSKSSSRSLKEESANTSVRWWSLVLLLSNLLDKVSKKLE